MTLVYREELSINSCLGWEASGGSNAFIFKGNASIGMEKGGEWKDINMEICARVSGKLLAIQGPWADPALAVSSWSKGCFCPGGHHCF